MPAPVTTKDPPLQAYTGGCGYCEFPRRPKSRRRLPLPILWISLAQWPPLAHILDRLADIRGLLPLQRAASWNTRSSPLVEARRSRLVCPLAIPDSDLLVDFSPPCSKHPFPIFNRKCGLCDQCVPHFSPFSTPVDRAVENIHFSPANSHSDARNKRRLGSCRHKKKTQIAPFFSPTVSLSLWKTRVPPATMGSRSRQTTDALRRNALQYPVRPAGGLTHA